MHVENVWISRYHVRPEHVYQQAVSKGAAICAASNVWITFSLYCLQYRHGVAHTTPVLVSVGNGSDCLQAKLMAI